MGLFDWFKTDEDVHDLAASQAEGSRFGGWSTKINWVQREDGLPHAGSVESEQEESGWRWRLW